MKYVEFTNFKEFCSCTGVYRIRCIESGKCYVGATTRASFTKRYTWHKNHMLQGKLKSKMIEDYQKYGIDGFVFEVIFVSDNPDEIANTERKYISEYKENGLSYNVKSGGDFCHVSQETIDVISNKAKEEAAHRKISEDTKRKISETLSNGHSSLAILTVKEVEEIKKQLIENVSIEELSSKYNISVETIRNIKFERRWKYVNVDGWDDYVKTLPHPHTITEEQEKEIISMLKNGYNKHQILVKFGVSYDKIRSLMKKYNI